MSTTMNIPKMCISVAATCRICLSNCAVRNVFLFKRKFYSVKVSSQEMMASVLSLQVKQGDGLPDKVCQKCYSKLYSAYKLKHLAESSHSILISHLCKKPAEESRGFGEEIKTDIKEEIQGSINIEENDLNFSFGLDSNPLRAIKGEGGSPPERADEGAWVDDDDDLPLRIFETDTKPSLPEVKKENSCCTEKDAPQILLAVKVEGKAVASGGGVKSSLTKTEGMAVCDLCGKLVRNMATHRRTHSAARKVFPCAECPRVFNDSSGRRRHRATEHLGQLYYCQICKKHFKHGEGHVSFMHSARPKDFQCVMCDMRFFTQSRLNNHVTVHTKERAFPCPVCAKPFRTKADSNYHRRSVHDKEKSYVCQYCPKAFFSSTKMKEHLRTHTEERTYKCKECCKGFYSCSSLRLHERRHAGVKDVPCTLCPKTFINKGNLRSHMLTHTKEKTFPCKYCGVKFGRSDHRSRHQRTAHESKGTFN